MNPNVYYYNETSNGFELFLGDYSTLEGLSLFDQEASIEITSFGATCYKKYGWATEKELPKFDNVSSIISFLKSEGDIGIIDFTATLPRLGKFSTHDDAECHFILESKHLCLELLKQVAPQQYRDMLINKLLNHRGLYITCSVTGIVKKHGTFDEYIATHI